MVTISESQYQTLAGQLVDAIASSDWATAWNRYAQLYATGLGLAKSISFEAAAQVRADLEKFREVLTAAESATARSADQRRLIRFGTRLTP